MTHPYKIGTQAEFEILHDALETAIAQHTNAEADVGVILNKIQTGVQILDEWYGAHRNWQDEGGYVAVFTDTTSDDNEELQGLLGQYNQDTDCLELADTLATAFTEDGIVDWLSEIYLIGTEFAVQIVRPRLREMFDEHTPRYLSRDTAEYIPAEIHVFLYRSIEKLREKKQLDYLQVFELNLDDDEKILKIRHRQEEPEHDELHFMVVPLDVEYFAKNRDKWDGKKLYVIDDGVAITTVFPYER